ncbi:MAG: DUF3078 domain-containing protein [Prevotella sp.]|nr:DUF3078 domain-containing protein [Prevotella sp.]
MRYYRYIVLLMAVVLTVGRALAQSVRENVEAVEIADTLLVEETPDTAQVVKDFIDSLAVLRHQLDSVQQVNARLRKESTDGRYYRLFAPTTFYHSGAHKWLSLSPQTGDEVTDAVDEAMMSLYLHRPDLVRENESALKDAGALREDVNKEITPQVELTEIVTPVVAEEAKPQPLALVVQKPNFWKFKGEGYLQFLQNYVSENWHKGGESNYSAQGAATLELNYNDHDKVTFENKLEMKLGLMTSPSDTVNKFKTNNDLLRLTSKLGIQAYNRWYYTLQLLTYTQFARGLKANDKRVYSDFTSPIDVNVGLGMEYKVEALNKRLTGTLNFLPLSFNFRYVARKNLASANGIRGDHHTMEDFASQFTGELKWQMLEQLAWKTRLFAITTYSQSKIEWENQFEFRLTKYISANLFIYPRFDDSNKRDENMGYFQLQEWSSIGLSYTW